MRRRLVASAVVFLVAVTWVPAQADGPLPAGVVLAPSAGTPGRVPVVALDPGHGGPDGGATENGLVERDLNLAIALDLQQQLRDAGIAVVMTRTTAAAADPNYVSASRTESRNDLQARVDIANTANADLFISIHNNSSSIAADRGTDLGVSSWPPQAWKIGGGTVWGWVTYDPELNAIYYGVANPGPWNQEQRPGDNKWTSGIFARDPASGQARWFYQYTPHDEHDYDGVNEQLLLDLPFGGEMRKVLVHPDRNGYVYVIDRRSGQVLSADPFGPVNSSKGVDLQSGRLVLNEEKTTHLGRTTHDICPTASGAKDWEPSSFSPDTGLIYIPHANICMDWQNTEVNYIAGTPYVGADVHMKPGPGGNRGQLTAWDPVNRRPAWIDKEKFPIWSGTVATGGGLVFYGTMDGWFKAVDAGSGKELWKYKVDSGVIGQPVSYRGPDGHQYIAVLSGVGGWSGAVVSGPVDPRDGSAALGFVSVMSDLPKYTTAGGTLYVFTLPH